MPDEPDDRRTRILDASEQLFAESGFDATPRARSRILAEVPKGLVFYYFPHKIELLRRRCSNGGLPAPTRSARTTRWPSPRETRSGP